jgi:hypothetical protein
MNITKPYFTRYAEEITENLGYGATWTPGTPLRLGTVGTFRNGVLLPLSHLDSLGIEFETESDPSPTTYTHMSEGDVSLSFKASGETDDAFQALAKAEAGAAVSFARGNAVLFSAGGCSETRVADVPGLEADLIRAAREGRWKPKWAVVTHLVEAESATIMLSTERGSRVELRAGGTVGQGPLDLADLSGGVSLASAGSLSQMIVAESGLTPLFHAYGIKRKLLRDDYQGGFMATDDAADDPFERIDFDADSLDESMLDSPA